MFVMCLLVLMVNHSPVIVALEPSHSELCCTLFLMTWWITLDFVIRYFNVTAKTESTLWCNLGQNIPALHAKTDSISATSTSVQLDTPFNHSERYALKARQHDFILLETASWKRTKRITIYFKIRRIRFSTLDFSYFVHARHTLF